MSLPANAAFAVSPRRSRTTGTPRRVGLGPNIVERTRCATVERPAAVTATNVGQPLKRQVARERFVKAMYPPTLPSATNDLDNLIRSCEVLQVRVATTCEPPTS